MKFLLGISAILMAWSFNLEANVNDYINRVANESEQLKQAVPSNQINDIKTDSFAQLEEYKPLVMSVRNSKNSASRQGGKPAEGAILFISFSMPEETILALADEARSYGIPVVIKGLIDSDFKKTLEKIMALHEKAKETGRSFSGFSIDPVWFEQFEINTVPALVVTRRPSWCLYQKACPNQPFDMVLGNAYIRKSLKVIADKGEQVPEVARMILEKHHV
ncbi:putative conjugative transfer protein TrbC [Legionella busanensis]|uniref:Putative conjugative transfer protein TrbC n=1 Tax=Legionella busanensis TaxID=190655 RepID=A0A378KAQ7_9GAMM|nr:type-F conjugative transfer system pilin assembly protein TrbC [Legionella busanensis]STX81263.1 putative conjugative transfer protein TrbC [Legionella busanensis]